MYVCNVLYGLSNISKHNKATLNTIMTRLITLNTITTFSRHFQHNHVIFIAYDTIIRSTRFTSISPSILNRFPWNFAHDISKLCQNIGSNLSKFY